MQRAPDGYEIEGAGPNCEILDSLFDKSDLDLCSGRCRARHPQHFGLKVNGRRASREGREANRQISRPASHIQQSRLPRK